MPTDASNLQLLQDPVSQELLHSTHLARLAYTWHDGTPRVIPIWFYWNGEELVMGTPTKAPKAAVLPDRTEVAVTIDSEQWPYHALLLRGTARTDVVEGVVPEYALAAERYFGEEQGRAWVGTVKSLFAYMTRICVKPTAVRVLDFETRFPSAIAAAMAGQPG